MSRSSEAASFLVVRFFNNLNYGGTTWEYYSTSACTSGVVKNSYDSFFVGGNNAVSSFQGFSNCKIELYDDTNFGGAILPYASARSYVGDTFNDKASSFRARG